MRKKEVKGRAIGGLARAEKLTPEQRKAIAQKAANARWTEEAETALKSGRLKIGEITIPCAVLEDKTRVLSERAITKAFGGKRGGSHWKRIKDNPDGANLPVFLSAKNIIPFIDKDLLDGLARRRHYKTERGIGGSHGIEAALLPKICNTLLKVRDADAFYPAQLPIIIQADFIMRGLAEVGIIALVDEATGYLDEKRRNEYRELFKEFIRNACKEWEREFPEAFFDLIYRLYGVTKSHKTQRPRFFSHVIRRYIYIPLANSNGAILEMLDEKNPVVYTNGGRRYKLFQFLTETVGLPAIREHIWQVVGIGRASKDRGSFNRNFMNAFPQTHDQLDMLLDD